MNDSRYPQPGDSTALLRVAYRWRAGALQPIDFPQQIQIDTLLGIDRQKNLLLDNTRQFVAGLPANHVLLTGSRGTGKSSLVKALLPLFANAGLRLIEVPPASLVDLPDIVAPLRLRPHERFILYVDDFSIGSGDPALAALKAALDGGIEEPPDNVLIYATSNRRHLLPEYQSDNAEAHWEGAELHQGEAVEEKIALSERFGVWLSFQPFSQDQFLAVVKRYLEQFGYDEWNEALQQAALRWALKRGSRSGRVAQQFARDEAGRRGLAGVMHSG